MTKIELKKARGFIRTYPYACSDCVRESLSDAKKLAVDIANQRDDYLAKKDPSKYLENLKEQLIFNKMFPLL